MIALSIETSLSIPYTTMLATLTVIDAKTMTDKEYSHQLLVEAKLGCTEKMV